MTQRAKAATSRYPGAPLASRRRSEPVASQRIGELQARQQREEQRMALRALLMQPLMSPEHAEFPAVRRHAEALREWFAREDGRARPLPAIARFALGEAELVQRVPPDAAGSTGALF